MTADNIGQNCALALFTARECQRPAVVNVIAYGDHHEYCAEHAADLILQTANTNRTYTTNSLHTKGHSVMNTNANIEFASMQHKSDTLWNRALATCSASEREELSEMALVDVWCATCRAQLGGKQIRNHTRLGHHVEGR